MNKFEEMGRELDKALERLHEVAKEKMGPATRDKTARVLRSVSGTLTKLADDLEPKSASKEQ